MHIGALVEQASCCVSSSQEQVDSRFDRNFRRQPSSALLVLVAMLVVVPKLVLVPEKVSLMLRWDLLGELVLVERLEEVNLLIAKIRQSTRQDRR